MLDFDFLEKGLEIVPPPHNVHDFQEERFSCYILSNDQISTSYWLYFLKYWTIWVLQLFVNQDVTSYILKLILSF